MTLNFLKYGVLVNFSRFSAVTHVSKVNCAEMAKDRPRQPAINAKFLTLNVDFSSLRPDYLRSTRPVNAGAKDGYSLKKWLFLYYRLF